MSGSKLLGCVVVALGALSACSQAPTPSGQADRSARPAVDERYVPLEHEYVVFVLKQYPVVATYLGGSAFDTSLAQIDGRLRDYSPAAISREDAQLDSFRARFKALEDVQLSPRRKVDRAIALAQIEFLLHLHDVRRYQERSLDSYVDEPFRGIDWQIQGMTPTADGRSGTPAEWQLVVARAHAVKAYLATAESQLAAGVRSGNAPDWRVLRAGAASALDDAEYFSRTLPGLAKANLTGDQSAAILKDLQQAGDEAAAAYRHLRDFLLANFFENITRVGAHAMKPAFRADHFAFGEAEYDWALHNNLRVDTTASKLYEESWPIVEATRAQVIALAKEIATAHHWTIAGGDGALVKGVFAHLSEDAPKTDAEMIEGYKKTGERLVQYARDTALFDVPAQYKLDVFEVPPPLRASFDGAAYYPAPPFKSTGVGRFYVLPTGNDRAQLRQTHNRVAMADLAAHEGFPGHDWHYKVMSQYRDTISPVRWLTPGAVEDSSSMWEDSMAAEGWGLYAEALMAEPQPKAPHGFYTPEEHLYQLRGKLYRDLRVRLDTGLHTGRISFDDAVTQFSEVVDFLPGKCTDQKALADNAKRASCSEAVGAINRYARWPTQAITYRLGRDAIVALREKAQSVLGERFSAQQFHLEFMKQGTVPAGYFADELESTLARSR